jgi:RNA-directed DNA polymerase
MARAGYEMVRYADDFVVLCRSEAEAAQALAMIGQWTAAAGLVLHPVKTRTVDARQQLQSRMREICTSGSEGGGDG